MGEDLNHNATKKMGKDESGGQAQTRKRGEAETIPRTRNTEKAVMRTVRISSGESDEEFVSISSNSDKAPRVSWTCEHCTYVNNPGVKVCAMCYKTSKFSREGGSKHKHDENK